MSIYTTAPTLQHRLPTVMILTQRCSVHLLSTHYWNTTGGNFPQQGPAMSDTIHYRVFYGVLLLTCLDWLGRNRDF